MKSASVYLRRGYYYVHPQAGSDGGDPCLFIEPVTKLEEGVDPAVLGNAVHQALSLSHHHAPWPTDWKHVADPLYQAAGVKSESTFVKGARTVSVNQESGIVTVIPTTSKEYRNAFSALNDKLIKLKADDPRELGLAVTQGLALSD